MTKHNPKVLLLMSGGVDSSYCAYILQKQGYEVEGMYLRLHDCEEKHAKYLKNIKACENFLNIKCQVVDAKEAFKQKVYDYFVDSYEKGQTPNPCAMCNPHIKFSIAFELANQLGCEFVATGHYARITNGKIAQARDPHKDQSYFLFALKPEWIERIIFPLGEEIKAELKPKALSMLPWLGTLETYKDSQEICFVDKTYIEVLKKHTQVEKEGAVLNTQGQKIGTHKGYMQYTIGKRKGFNVLGSHTPNYVLSINPKDNTIVVGAKELLAQTKVYSKLSSLNPKAMELAKDGKLECEAKIRYKSNKEKVCVSLQDDMLIAEFKNPVYGVAKGQALVLYQQEEVLGGGFIV